MYFFVWRLLYFESNFTKICSQEPNKIGVHIAIWVTSIGIFFLMTLLSFAKVSFLYPGNTSNTGETGVNGDASTGTQTVGGTGESAEIKNEIKSSS